MTATVFVCGGIDAYERRILRCPKEKHRRRFVVGYGSPWYPPRYHCLGCGIVIEPGEGYHRLRTDTARRKAIAKARALWDATPSGRVQFDDEHYPMRRA